ncbi:MAG TPA: hypothetical protein DCQ31_19380 [Bacteroidales bacterium]|nr:hypothetical protein [Bacteroidales bacterium]
MRDDRDILEFYKLLNQNILISYTGSFDNQILAVIAKNIEFVLQGNPKVSKKIFKIFFELAQNISYYSDELIYGPNNMKSGEGTLVIKETDKGYLFITGNLVKNEKAGTLIEKIKKINELNRDALREFKRAERNRPRGEQGGANIGLIQVALTSENELLYKVVPFDDERSFYIIGALISK